jgi:osmotically-inducible protein OsmY
MSKTDIQLKQDIIDELQLDPQVNAAQIGVSVKDGAVTLLGTVDSYAEKCAAETATKRVHGARTIAQDLTVMVRTDHAPNDSEIAAAIQNALDWNVYIPKTVSVKVEKGSVTLEGKVDWNYQRVSSERAVQYLPGVVSVLNMITLNPQPSVTHVKEAVEAALRRQAAEDAKSIHVETSGGIVTLTGHASSWQAISDAVNAAWAIPGVTEVSDHVVLSTTN